jgi:DNA-binding CsgD family transcriptional regulator
MMHASSYADTCFEEASETRTGTSEMPAPAIGQSAQNLPQAELALGVLDRLPHGVVVVDDRLEIGLINITAYSLLRQNDGLAIYQNRLVTANSSQTTRLRELVRRVAKPRIPAPSPRGLAIKISRPSSRRPFEVLITPLSMRAAQGTYNLSPALFIFDPEAETKPPNEIVAHLYGLTAAEVRVAVLLMQGRTLKEISMTVQRTKETVRKHLQSIFDKTDTNRQGQLIRLLVGGPASLRF